MGKWSQGLVKLWRYCTCTFLLALHCPWFNNRQWCWACSNSSWWLLGTKAHIDWTFSGFPLQFISLFHTKCLGLTIKTLCFYDSEVRIDLRKVSFHCPKSTVEIHWLFLTENVKRSLTPHTDSSTVESKLSQFCKAPSFLTDSTKFIPKICKMPSQGLRLLRSFCFRWYNVLSRKGKSVELLFSFRYR